MRKNNLWGPATQVERPENVWPRAARPETLRRTTGLDVPLGVGL